MRAIPLSLMLAGAVAAAACNPAEPPTTGTPGTVDRSAVQGGENDEWITTQVEARFYGNARVPNQISVSTSDAVVTLSGRVDAEQAESEAVRIARGVDGVREVRSRLTVPDATAAADRSGREDARAERDEPARDETGPVESAWITTKIQSQYFLNRDVKARNIDVTTRDGVVTLSGSVENEAQREHAVRIARDTEGVRDVRDRLRIGEEPAAGAPRADARVDPGRPISDDDLETLVQSRFYQDDDMRAHRIDVEVDDAVVTLSGEVDNETRRRQAVSLAMNIDGVRDVRDRIEVAEEERPATAATAERDDERGLGERIEDGWITTKIQAQLYLDADLRGREIDVETEGGVVTLAGEVESERHRQIALETARETDGVKDVVDRLRVVTSVQER